MLNMYEFRKARDGVRCLRCDGVSYSAVSPHAIDATSRGRPPGQNATGLIIDEFNWYFPRTEIGRLRVNTEFIRS